MGRAFLLFLCLAVMACAPVAPQLVKLPQEASGGSQVEIQTVVEEIAVGQAAGNSGSVEIQGGDEQTLREFIKRYFARVYPGAMNGDTKIVIGGLPDDLPLDLPLPESARVVATVQEPEAFTQIILDAPLSPDQVDAFYSQAISDLGWTPAPPRPSGGGFTSFEEPRARFCLGEDEAYLSVYSKEQAQGSSDVRINLQTSPDVIYSCQEQDPGYMDPGSHLIPSLESPQGALLSGSEAGSSSDGSAYNSANLETDLSVDELLAHYNGLLEENGWKLVDQGTSEVLAWSTWKLADAKGDPWGGTLVVMENRLESSRRFAMVSVEKMPEE